MDPSTLILAAPTSCALRSIGENEELIFAVSGTSGLDSLKRLADEIGREGGDECSMVHRVSEKIGEDPHLLNLAFSLFEAYLGGVNLVDIDLETSKKIHEGYEELRRSTLAQNLRGLADKERIINYILNEIRDRFAHNIVYPPKSVFYSRAGFLISSEDLYWILGFLWPKAMGMPDPSLVGDITVEVKKHIDGGESVVLYGRDDLLRRTVYYLVVERLIDQGYRVVYGSPRRSHLIPKTVYVCERPQESFLTPYISVSKDRFEHGSVYSINIDEHDTRDLQRWFAEKVFEKDGVPASDEDVLEIVERYYGDLSLIETLSLYLSVTGGKARDVLSEKADYRLSDIIEKIIAKLGVDEKVSSMAAAGLLVFPKTFIKGENDSLEKILLYDDSLGLYSFRNEQWLNSAKNTGLGRKSFDLDLLWKAPSPFHSSWSTLKSRPDLATQVFSKALNTLYDTNSYPIIEALAILYPDLFHKTLYTYTTYRLELLSGIISENGNWFSSASLILDISVEILRKLAEGGESRYLERYLSLLLKTVQYEIDLGFADTAYQRLLEAWNMAKSREVSPLVRAEITGTLGIALAGMGRADEAERRLKEAINIIDGELENKDIPQRAKFLSGLALLAEERGDLEKAFQLYKKALDILIALVYRGACEYSENMYQIAEKMKGIREGYKDWRVCGGLVKCGAFELSNKYGCH